jgi:hypothetical protein
MNELPMEWEINQNRPMNAEHLRAALAEIEAYSEERSGDEPQEEATA